MPLKWRKYLKLVDFDLVSLADLKNEIKRYPRSATARLICDLEHDIRQEFRHNRQNLYVVKLVSPGRQGQLPNFRVESLAELERLCQFLAANVGGEHTEVWFCRTRIDQGVFSVAGRFMFTRDGDSRSHLVEQVWRSSPRLLEILSSTLPCPYARATRYGWGWSYFVERIHLPERWMISRDQLMGELSYSLRLFEAEREKIEIFLSFLDSFSFNA